MKKLSSKVAPLEQAFMTIEFEDKSKLFSFWDFSKMHFRHIVLQEILYNILTPSKYEIRSQLSSVVPPFNWFNLRCDVHKVTIFQEILRWDHQRSCHIYKERYARCLNWSKKYRIFPVSWLLDKSMLRLQRFSFVIGTWPCRLLKPKERYESLLLIAIVSLNDS